MTELNVNFWRGFIAQYKSSPCLWQIRSPWYRNRVKREHAYDQLLIKLKEIEPTATRDDVIKKIGNLRSSYRKEEKKVMRSVAAGATGENVHKPKLWYYSLLSFVGDQATLREGRTIKEDAAITAEGEATDPLGESIYVDSSTAVKQETHDDFEEDPNCPSQYGASSDGISPSVSPIHQEDDPPPTIERRTKKPRLDDTQDDRFDLIGKTMAMKMRGLRTNQMLIAERLINETLFRAEMNLLTLNHRLSGGSSHVN